MEDKSIIIFDGECNLCYFSVKFIIQHDKDAKFVFAPLKTNTAKSLMSEYKLDCLDTDSILFIKGGNSYLRADAIFEILKDLQGGWSLLRIFRFLPASLNNFLYRCIAKNRYRIFGKTQQCMTPSADIRSRFIMDVD